MDSFFGPLWDPELEMGIIEKIEQEQLNSEIKTDFRPGDTVKVHVRITEGEKQRIQVFQGVVIRMSKSGSRETFTVRKMSFGTGVERVFPLHSPNVTNIEVTHSGKVRRAKLYYLRDLTGKKARLKDRNANRGRATKKAAAQA